MYIDKQVKRGYNEYIRLDEGIGKDAMMDVALLVMEDGDTYSFEEPEKELAALVFDGKCTLEWDDQSSITSTVPIRLTTTRPACMSARVPRSRLPHTAPAISIFRRP